MKALLVLTGLFPCVGGALAQEGWHTNVISPEKPSAASRS